MKRKILVVIISFFLFSLNVNAAKVIENIQIDAVIDASGDVLVTETWRVGKQSDETYFEKNFKNLKDVKINDIKISDESHGEYEKTDKFENKDQTYVDIRKGDLEVLRFKKYYDANVYTINYKVSGMITDFKDTFGIDWYFLCKNNYQEISTLNIRITGPVPFTTDNTGLYVFSNNDVTCKIESDSILLFASNLGTKTQIRFISSFIGMEFANTKKSKDRFDVAISKAKNKNELLEELQEFFSKEVIKVFIYIIGGILIVVIISKLINRFKKYNEYNGIKYYGKVKDLKMDNVDYVETVPLNGNLYKLAFISGYFKISKNRSDLIGAILLKWLYEGKVLINKDHEKPFIKIMDNQYFENKLDYDLYNMLVQASNSYQIDNTRLIRYASEHYIRVMTWFNMGYNESINDEYNRGHIKRGKRRKKAEVVLTDEIYNYAKEILGLKKYLLNFNQVPRQTELTEESYKYLLIMASLLGIGKQVAKEILRKNPDNYMANALLDMEDAKFIYGGVYDAALIPYKQIMKTNKIKSDYDAELEDLLKGQEKKEERKSVL